MGSIKSKCRWALPFLVILIALLVARAVGFFGATYGPAMDASLTHYLSANETWNLFHGYGRSLKPLLRDSGSPSLMGSGKLLNLGLLNNDFFITAGKGYGVVDNRPITDKTPTVRPVSDLRFSSNFPGVVLWSYETLSPVAKFAGNSVKTHATISPNGQ